MKRVTLLALLLALALPACNYAGFARETPTAHPTVPLPTSTATIAPSSTPTLTPTATPAPLGSVPFPVQPLSPQQVSDVAGCAIKGLAEERYPKGRVKVDGLEQAFSPRTNCEWAVLAYAYSVREEGDEPSAAGMRAYERSLVGNYGYALATDNFYRYFNSVPLVDVPGMAAQEITRVRIVYKWWGMGEPSSVQFALTIAQANTTPLILTDSSLIKRNLKVDKPVIQALRTGLTDLLPVDSKFQLLTCTDNSPSWQVQLTFADGSTLDMETDSNMIYIGGPWQTEIDGQTYFQASPAFAIKMGELAKALELPLGEPFAMACFADPVFEAAFSKQVPARSPTPNSTLNAISTAAASTVNAALTQTAAATP